MSDLTPEFNGESGQLSFFTDMGSALAMGVLDHVPALLDKGADINSADSNGNTILMVAARQGNMPLVRRLLDAGADTTRKNDDGRDALYQAARAGKPDTTGALLVHGMRLDEATYIEAVLERFGAPKNDRAHLSSAPLFIARGMNIDAVDHNGNSALILAVICDDFPTVRWLVENGANLEVYNNSHNTALALAVFNDRREIAEYLIKEGADPYNRFYGERPINTQGHTNPSEMKTLIDTACADWKNRVEEKTRAEQEARATAEKQAKEAYHAWLRRAAPKIIFRKP